MGRVLSIDVMLMVALNGPRSFFLGGLGSFCVIKNKLGKMPSLLYILAVVFTMISNDLNLNVL